MSTSVSEHNPYAGTDPAPTRRPKMSSKLTLSFAVALALSAVGGVARANPIPTSTDEARALAGQVTSQQQIDHAPLANGPVTSTDDARAEMGRLLPASISPSLQALIARDTDEGRAAFFFNYQASTEKESLAGSPAGSDTADRHN